MTTNNEIFEAMANVQREIELPKLNSDNPFFKSRYVDLSGVITCLKDALVKYDLSVSGTAEVLPTGEWVWRTDVRHKSGGLISSYIPLIFNSHEKTAMQSIGSSVTYARRYGLCAAFNIAADLDDDDETNRGKTTKPMARPAQKRLPPVPPVGDGGEKIPEEWVDLLLTDLNLVRTFEELKNLKDRATTWKPDLTEVQYEKIGEAIKKAQISVQNISTGRE